MSVKYRLGSEPTLCLLGGCWFFKSQGSSVALDIFLPLASFCLNVFSLTSLWRDKYSIKLLTLLRCSLNCDFFGRSRNSFSATQVNKWINYSYFDGDNGISLRGVLSLHVNLRPWTNKLFTVTQEILILFNFAADFHLSQYLPFIHQQWRSLTNSGSLTPSFWWSHRLWSDCSGELLQRRIISRLLAAYSIHVVFLRISGNSSWTWNPTFHIF